MSEIKAPEVEPVAPKMPPRPRGKYIDFAPRHKKPVRRPAAKAPTPRATVVVVPPAVKRPIFEESVVEEPTIDETLVSEEPEEISEEDILKSAFPEEEETSLDDYGPLAEFNNFDEEEETSASEAQEDFISDDISTNNYVEEVLSQISETRTETTVRRSPFLKNYHVEKRPLSDRIPIKKKVTSPEALEPTPRKEFKQDEFERHADSVPDNAETPVVTKAEKTGSRLGVIITVAVTILLGAGVGVFVYLAFFR